MLVIHELEHIDNKMNTNEDRPFIACEYTKCKKTFENNHEMMIHIARIHELDKYKDFKCDYCGR